MTGTLDLSTLPPAVVVAILVIWLIGRILPDQIGAHEADRPATQVETNVPTGL